MSTPSLTIRGLETRAIRVPMRRPLVTSRGAITQAPIVLIDLQTDEGVARRVESGALKFLTDIVQGDGVEVDFKDDALRVIESLLQGRP